MKPQNAVGYEKRRERMKTHKGKGQRHELELSRAKEGCEKQCHRRLFHAFVDAGSSKVGFSLGVSSSVVFPRPDPKKRLGSFLRTPNTTCSNGSSSAEPSSSRRNSGAGAQQSAKYIHLECLLARVRQCLSSLSKGVKVWSHVVICVRKH